MSSDDLYDATAQSMLDDGGSEKNEYDDVAQSFLTDQRSTARIREEQLLSSSSINPEQHVENLDMAEKLKVPPVVVENAREDALREVQKLKIAETKNQSADVFDWASSPSNAPVAYDDLDALGSVQKFFSNVTSTLFSALYEMAETGTDISRSVFSSPGEVIGSGAQGAGQALQGAFSFFDEMGLAGEKGSATNMILAGLSQRPALLGQALEEVGKQVSTLTGALEVPQERQGVHTIAGGTVGQIVATVFAPEVMLPSYFASSGSVEYDKALAAGANKEEAVAVGILSGAVDTGSEYLGTGKIAKLIPKNMRSQLLKDSLDVVAASGIEVLEEWVAEVGKQLVHKGVYQHDAEIDLLPLSSEEVKGMGFGVAVLAALGKRASYVQQKEAQKSQVESNINEFKELREAAEQSKVYQRSKKHFADFIENVNPEKGDPNIYIDAEGANEYFQSVGEDGMMFFDGIELGHAYREAMENGADVKIPLSAFITLESSEHFNGLLNDVRYASGGNTAREIENINETTSDEILVEAQALLEESSAAAEVGSVGLQVHDLVMKQLVDTERFNSDIAAQYAQMHQAFATTLIERNLATPDQVSRYYDLKVVDQTVVTPADANTFTQEDGDNIQTFFQGDNIDDSMPLPENLEEAFADVEVSKTDVEIEAEFTEQIKDFDQTAERYNDLPDSEGGKILNTDIARELSEEYLIDRSKSAAVHEPASGFIKQLFAEKLKEAPAPGEKNMVLFTAGGTGAGKTTAIENLLDADFEAAQIVFDTNMNSYESSKKKVDQALAAGKSVQIALVIRDPVDALVNGALPRAVRQEDKFGSGRTVPLSAHVSTHIGAAETVKRLADDFKDNDMFEVDVIDNSRGKGREKIVPIDKIPEFDYNDIAVKLKAALENEYETGNISEGIYKGFAEELPLVEGEKHASGPSDNEQHETQHSDSRESDGGSGSGNDGQSLQSEVVGQDERGQAGSLQGMGILGDQEIPDGEQEAVELNQTTDSRDPRGSITFSKSGVGTNTTFIKLLEGANLSTFIHESGHFFVEVIRDLAQQPSANPETTQTIETLSKWFGTKKFGTKQHEQFARGFEAYIREGKAPSVELQSVFDRFMGWLLQIYQKVSDLNVRLNAEVRQVMDRMLATDAAIAEVENAAAFGMMFESAEQAGVSPDEFTDMQAAAERAHNESLADLRQKQMQQLERTRTKVWRQERKNVRAEVTDQIFSEPVYQLKHLLMHGSVPGQLDLPEALQGLKINRQALVDQYGQEKDAFWHQLPVGKFSAISKDGQHPDVIAELFGFDSGDAMIKALIAAGNINKTIDARIEDEMIRRHGDLMRDNDQLTQEAMKAVTTRSRAQHIYSELRTLGRHVGVKPVPQKVIIDAARRQIAKLNAREIQPHRYLNAMRKNSQASTQSMVDGDNANAYKRKAQQLLNYQLYNEALKAKDRIASTQKYLKKFQSPGVRKKLDRDYLDQIDNILESVSLKQSVSNKEIDRRKTFAEWYQTRLDSNESVEVPIDYLERLKTHYRDMNVADLETLRDVITNIEHLAKLKQKLKVGAEDRDFNETMDAAHTTALGQNPQKFDPADRAPKKFRRVKSLFDKLRAHHIKMEFLAEQLDGDVENGTWWNIIFRPMADAENKENDMLESARENLSDVLTSETFKNLNQKVFINNKAGSYDRNQLLAMALNWGNAGNRDALARGLIDQGLDMDSIQELLNRELSKSDWDTIQKVWDFIDSYWKDIAALQKKLTGVTPEKVERSAIKTPHGEYSGGYYPLVYDTELSYKAFARDQKLTVKELLETNFLRPTTRKGHTVERVGSAGQPVKLDIGIISQHINNVVHDLAYREAVIGVDRVIQDSRTRDAVERIAGREAYRAMRPWLANVANSSRMLTDPGEIAAKWMRKNSTIVNMGFKLTTAIVQPLGYTQSFEVLGEKWAMHGLNQFYGNPLKAKALRDEIYEKSSMMRNRSGAFDRDINDAIAKLKKESGKLNQMQQWAFKHIGFMDLTISLPTWKAGYDKSLSEGMSEADAVAQADKVVRMSQSAGGAKDLALIQQGNEYKRMFTMFYSYFSSMYNLMRRRRNISARSPITASKVARNTMAFMYLVALPAVLAELIVGRGPDEDEDESVASWAAEKVLSYPLMSVVGVRDIAQGAIGDFGYSMTPVAQGFEAAIRGVTSLDDLAEGDEKALKNMTMAAGYLFGLPSRQLWTTVNNINDLADGESLNWSELLMLREHRN